MKTKNLLIVTVAALSLTACNNNDEMENVVDVSNTLINFTTGVNDLTAKTRAGYETGTLTEGSFGLFLTTDGTLSSNLFNTSNREFTYKDGAWGSTGTQLLWKNNTANVEYVAYLPYNAAALETTGTPKLAYPFNVAADQRTAAAIKAADFLYVKGTTTGTESGTNGIALGFSHKMCKLTINLSRGTELAEDVTFTGVDLGYCCRTATTINLADGTVATKPTDETSYSMIKTYATTPQTTYECILVPQIIYSDVRQLKVLIQGSNNIEYAYNASADIKFESGKAYTLDLTVGRDKVTLGSAITAGSWGTPINGGGLETE